MGPDPGSATAVLDVKGGQVEAADFVRERGESLYRYAYVLTGNRADAQDVVQTALLKALRHWDKVVAAAHPEAYVRKIVTTTFLSWREGPAHRETPVDVETTLAGRPAASPDPGQVVARADELARLVRDLPPRMRAVIVLRYYLDLDDADIAAELGIGRVAVRSTASRALATLRRHLDDSPTLDTDPA